METYDIVMLVVLIGTALFGAIKGFAWQLASIGSIVVSYMGAYNFREPLSQSIHAEPPWNRFLAMLILFIGTSLVIWVAFRMVSNTIDRLRLKEFDRQIGALFGLAKGGLYCILVTMFGVTLLGDGVREKIVVSRSGHYIASVLDRSEAIIPEEFQEVLEDTPVLVSDLGHEYHAYGLYVGDTVARDGYPDRIIIFRDTLSRDFGFNPDLLRAQIEQTVRHELAHHLGWDEPGVRNLGL